MRCQNCFGAGICTTPQNCAAPRIDSERSSRSFLRQEVVRVAPARRFGLGRLGLFVASAVPVHPLLAMDEKDFKKHLEDLAHGHHHPEEHDWGPNSGAASTKQPAKADRGGPAKGHLTRRARRRSK